MRIFEKKNTRVNCSALLVFPRALLALSSWHHAPATNRPRHNENKKNRTNVIFARPWKPLVCVWVIVRPVYSLAPHERVIQRVCMRLHVYRTPAPTAAVEWSGPTCWRWWQDDGSKRLFFHYFIVNTAWGCRGNARRSRSESENTGRHLEGRRRRGGGEDEACKRSASWNSQDATRMERSEFLAAGPTIGFQLTAHSQQLCEVDEKS